MKPNSEPPTYQLSADRKYLGPHILTCQINSIREDPPKVCSEPECRTKPGTEETHSGYLTLPLKKKIMGYSPLGSDGWDNNDFISQTALLGSREHKGLEICTVSLSHTAMHADSPASGGPLQRSYVWANQSVQNGAPQACIRLHSHNTAGSSLSLEHCVDLRTIFLFHNCYNHP